MLFAWSQVPDIDSLIGESKNATGKEKALLYSDVSYYSGFTNTDLALEYAQKCLDETLKTDDSLLIAEGYNSMAIAHYMKGNYRDALQFNLKALRIREKSGDAYSKLSSYSKTGNCYHELGMYDEAIFYYLKSLKISEENDFVRQTGLISNNIAELFKLQENYEKALEYFGVATMIAEQVEDTIGLSRALTNQGVMYKQTGRFEKADSLYKLAYRLLDGKDYYDLRGGLLINFGALYKAWGQPEKSIGYYQQAEKLYEKSGELHGQSIVLANLGNSYLENGNPQKALAHYRKSIEVSKATRSLPRMINAYRNITNYYRATSDYRNAFRYDSLADVLRDSVFSIEKARIMTELNTKYETEKKEKQIAEQKTILARQKVRVQQRNLMLLGTIGGIVVLLLGATLIIRNQKSKQQKLRQQVALEKAGALNRLQDEKLRISRDLHDNIGSQLTFVVSSLDNIAYIKDEQTRKARMGKLAGFTRDTMAQLRETIWALNAENISMDQLLSRIAEFTNHAKNASPKTRFSIENTSGNITLTAEQAINLYRTAQEAINNAVKYADAAHVAVKASGTEIKIEDDGRGFSRKEINEGNGLANMEQRMTGVGFQTVIDTAPGKGTRVKILLNGLAQTN